MVEVQPALGQLPRLISLPPHLGVRPCCRVELGGLLAPAAEVLLLDFKVDEVVRFKLDAAIVFQD